MVKPQPWSVNPSLIDADWMWAWEGLVFLAPLWGSGEDVVNHLLPEDDDGEYGPTSRGLAYHKTDTSSVNFRTINYGDLKAANPGSGNFTWSIWFMTSSVAERSIWSKADPSSLVDWWQMNMGISVPGRIQLEIDDDISKADISPTPTYNDGEWHNLVVTRSVEAGVEVFVDAVSVGSADAAKGDITTPTSADFKIGAADRTSTLDPFWEDLDMAMMWSRQLSSQEIQSLYEDPYGPIRPVYGYSETVAVIDDTTFPDSPPNLTAIVISNTQIDLSWDAVTNADFYDIERDGSIIVKDHPSTSYSDTGLTPGTHIYRVRSVKNG